jgi:hypothetical protein
LNGKYFIGKAVSSKMRDEKRKNVIKCCGRNSCTNVKPKKKQQLENKNASKNDIKETTKITSRQTTTSVLVLDTENQKSPTATLVEDTTLAAANPTDATIDPPSSEINSATNPETSISPTIQNFPSDSPTKESLAVESLIPAPTSTTKVEVSISTEILSSSTIGNIVKSISSF